MKPSIKPFAPRVLGGFSALLLSLVLCASSVLAISTVEGAVYDNKNNPLADVYVELLNNFGQSTARTRTDGTGRFRFDGLPDGRYSLRALAFTYDFYDQTKPLEITTQNIRGGEGVGYFQVDFYLVPKRVAFADSTLGVIFAQEIPSAAEKSYSKAVKDLENKRVDEGYTALNESIRLFPNYFDAIHRMGQELYHAKRYKDAIPYFIKANEVNPKSVTTLYYLGMSLHYLGPEFNKAAMTPLKEALVMAPLSPQVLTAIGTVERGVGKYEDAEKHLLQAKKLAKGASAEIHKELAQLYANDMKKYKEAADELDAYLKASNASGNEAKEVKKQIENLRAKAKNSPAS